MDVVLLVCGMNGKWAAQRRVRAKLGQKTKACLQVPPLEDNVCNDALHVIGLYGPGDKISLFLKDRELAKVALSCHMTLDMLCQHALSACVLS